MLLCVQVFFPELCFVKFQVFDSSSNHVTAQRVVPLTLLKPGKNPTHALLC